VSYRVQFEGGALVQLNGIPSDAFDALVERVVALVEEPWDAIVMSPGGDSAFRSTVFGGNGIMYFRVDEAKQLISIFDVVWAG
jgi:hypothetical protein